MIIKKNYRIVRKKFELLGNLIHSYDLCLSIYKQKKKISVLYYLNYHEIWNCRIYNA